jgi:hypothetical protein
MIFLRTHLARSLKLISLITNFQLPVLRLALKLELMEARQRFLTRIRSCHLNQLVVEVLPMLQRPELGCK